MLTAALFVMAGDWRQTRCSSTEQRIGEMWSICTVECYLGVEENDIVKFADKRMELEKVILSEVNQTQIDKYYMCVFASIWTLAIA